MSYNLLKGKNGIIFGALNENSIAWKLAEKAKEEGASFILSNTPSAIRLGNLNKLAEKTKSLIVSADASSLKDITELFDKAINYFKKKIDFILHSIGMSINIRKKNKYTNINYDWLQKSWNISSVSFHKIMKVAWDKKIMNKWGSIVAITYIGSQRVFPDYNDMSDHKSYLESIARNFGYYWGVKYKVRVNTISQSPTITTSSNKIKNFNYFIDYINNISPLGNTTASQCADYIVTLFSDLTRGVTMQNLYHDGGFSSTGINESFINNFKKN